MKIFLSNWHNNFFDDIYSFVKNNMKQNLENAILIMSTTRAKKIAREYFEHAESNALLPEIITVPEFLNYCYEGYLDSKHLQTREIDTLESIVFLYEIVQELAQKDEDDFYSSMLEFEQEETSFKRAELESFQHFYSYGQYLDDIIQECFEEDSIALSIHAHLDEVDGFAKYLLNNLRTIIHAYKAKLDKLSLHTKCYKKYKLAQVLKKEPSTIFKEKSLYFCGLDRITRTENICFEYFSHFNSEFLISSDLRLVSDIENAHWATTFYREWASNWQAQFALINENDKYKEKKQEIFFHQAFDTHSQFQNFKIEDASVSTACVLNSPNALMPLLHSLNPHFDDENLNCTMGYPLSESKVFQFFSIMTSFKDNARRYVNSKNEENIFISYSNFIDFISFPLFQIPLNHLKKEFKEEELPYINLSDIHDIFTVNKDLEQMVNKFIPLLLDWYKLSSLENLVNFVVKFEKLVFDNLHDKPLERLMFRRIHEKFYNWRQKSSILLLDIGYDLCVKLFFDCIKEESVPFEHHSNKAIQILGLRETRLLSFDTVHIFDANDEFLPPRNEENPLLPDNLRFYLGLKSLKLYELYTAHNWQRLLASANTVHLYWHESTAKGMFDTKKTRSPYVEEALWEVERQRGHILKPDGKEFTQAKCIVELPQRELSIPITDNIKEAMIEFFKGSMTATKLDTFMACPLKFFYQYIAKVKGVSEPKEEDDPRLIGNLVHKFMEALYPNTDEIVEKEILMGRYNSQIKLLDEYLEKENLYNVLPAESMLMLKNSFPYKMKRFIASQPESTKIVAREKTFSEKMYIKDKGISSFKDIEFKGTIDRIDERLDKNEEKKHIILDYKTGNITKKTPNKTFWEKEELFKNLEENVYNFSEEMARNLHLAVLKGLKSVQLPFYIFLTSRNNYSILDAVYVDLYESCAEKSILSQDSKVDEIIHTQIPLLLEFLMLYMQSMGSFTKIGDAACAYCEYKKYCD